MSKKITKENVEAVKTYVLKYPMLSQEEIGKLVGISASTVCYILKGAYDYLLEETEEQQTPKTIESKITYETYRRLLSCEMAFNEMLARTSVSNSDDNVLFIDYRTVSSIMQRYFPADFEARIDELREEEYENDYED